MYNTLLTEIQTDDSLWYLEDSRSGSSKYFATKIHVNFRLCAWEETKQKTNISQSIPVKYNSLEMYLTYAHSERERQRETETTSIYVSDRYFLRKLVLNSSVEWNGRKNWSRCLKFTNTTGITMESPLSHSHEEIRVNFLSSSTTAADSFPCKEKIPWRYEAKTRFHVISFDAVWAAHAL